MTGTPPRRKSESGLDAAADRAEPRRERFSHTVDIGVCGFGATRAQAFGQAVLVTTGVVTDPGCASTRDAVAIECGAGSVRCRRCAGCRAAVFFRRIRYYAAAASRCSFLSPAA
jgi:hypothetical protein